MADAKYILQICDDNALVAELPVHSAAVSFRLVPIPVNAEIQAPREYPRNSPDAITAALMIQKIRLHPR